MTEKEKAAAGLLYANYDAQLNREIERSKKLCHAYNSLSSPHSEEAHAMIREVLGKTGKNFTIVQPFYCDYGYNTEIGENFFANLHCVILDAAKVTFGNDVFVAPNCSFYTAGHPLDIEQRNERLEYAYPIRVGNNVWIGGNVVVLPGVTIGDGAVIGAGSVVTRDIPPNVIAVGNPCRVLHPITSADRDKYKNPPKAFQ